MSIIMRAQTSADDREIVECLRILRNTDVSVTVGLR